MFKCRFIVIILVFAFQNSFAQQNNIWYFGRMAGLSFAPSGVQPIPAVLTDGAMTTNEGCSSICDNNGNLLFYSNGVTIYNRLHQVMVNGDNLMGNTSSVQACVIVPVPGNDSLFYIFATDALENGFANGYTYSIINMKMDNGNGQVITKNSLLWASCSERMVAVRHANGRDVWLITNDKDSNIFRSWLINCSGLQPNPILSITGLVMNQYITTNTGMLKVSPDSKQICQTHFPEADVVGFAPNFCQLFDFDNATGILSNPITISFSNAKIVACEFSGDSKLLYLTSPDGKSIAQVESTLFPVAAVIASRTTISTGTSGYYGIQLAPDGKIYLSENSTSLGVINEPDRKGLGCNFRERQVLLSPGSSSLGLPGYINDLSVSPTNGFSYTITDSCAGTVQFAAYTTMPGTISWRWDFGDGNNSVLQNPVHTYTVSAQNYLVTLEITSSTGCGYIKRSKAIFPSGLSATVDFDFVADCDAGTVSFNNLSTLFPDSMGVHYLWSFGDGATSVLRDPVHIYLSGSYNVRLDLLTTTPCLNKSVTKILKLEVLQIQASPDQVIDVGTSVQLSATGGGTRFLWTPSIGLSNPMIANPIAKPARSTMYVVTAYNDAGCQSLDSVFIKVNTIPGIQVPSGFTPNNDGKNDVLTPFIADEFILQYFSIYNRWGQKVFSATQKNSGWQGKVNGIIQNSGIYVWMVRAMDMQTGKNVEVKGSFVLIR